PYMHARRRWPAAERRRLRAAPARAPVAIDRLAEARYSATQLRCNANTKEQASRRCVRAQSTGVST
ncbi:MAG TPA: hypothetical protein VM580_22885, partial [Labilithrix sp.]|nr:hypothetical protein [Labilithrix sp.]